MWQVFVELCNNREKAAHRIYTGTDAALGAQGGAPGIDIASLFGVSQTIVQGDLEALERGVLTGLIQPWAAINHNDSSCSPIRKYCLPDADADAERKSFGERMSAFNVAIKSLRDNGFMISKDLLCELARKFEVPEPSLPVTDSRGAQIYQYEIDGGIFTIDEVRGNKGFMPMPDGSGVMTAPASKAKADALIGPTAVLPTAPLDLSVASVPANRFSPTRLD